MICFVFVQKNLESGPGFGGEVRPGSEQSGKTDENSQQRIPKRRQLLLEFNVVRNVFSC